MVRGTLSIEQDRMPTVSSNFEMQGITAQKLVDMATVENIDGKKVAKLNLQQAQSLLPNGGQIPGVQLTIDKG